MFHQKTSGDTYKMTNCFSCESSDIERRNVERTLRYLRLRQYVLGYPSVESFCASGLLNVCVALITIVDDISQVNLV